MGSLEKVLGLVPVDPEAAELARVIGALTAASVREGRVAPEETDAAQARLMRIATGDHLPKVAIAASLDEVDLSVESVPDKSHRVTTMVLDDTMAA